MQYSKNFWYLIVLLCNGVVFACDNNERKCRNLPHPSYPSGHATWSNECISNLKKKLPKTFLSEKAHIIYDEYRLAKKIMQEKSTGSMIKKEDIDSWQKKVEAIQLEYDNNCAHFKELEVKFLLPRLLHLQGLFQIGKAKHQSAHIEQYQDEIKPISTEE